MIDVSKITPCLWFDQVAEEAANFYVGIFPNSRIVQISRYAEAMHGQPAGSVLAVWFEINGNPMIALNGGPDFTFSPAVSLTVYGETQTDIDYYWTRLCEGGAPEAQQCGWLTDKYGVSWQVVPSCLPPMLENTSSLGAKRAMEAFMKMKKFDIAALKEAYYGE